MHVHPYRAIVMVAAIESDTLTAGRSKVPACGTKWVLSCVPTKVRRSAVNSK